MASNSNKVMILEVCRISPSMESPESALVLSLTFTYFDCFWFRFLPVERIFFYELDVPSSALFYSVILPKLKRSLSITLSYFLPLAGNLTWPLDAKPVLSYVPNVHDAISLTIAESNADFKHLSGNGIREAVESHPYIPELHLSESSAPIIALQVTLFPDQGFCIGVSAHHATLDGKSTIMFTKAWAHICKQVITKELEEYPSLSPELTPFLDRSSVHDPDGLDMEYLKKFPANIKFSPKSLELVPAFYEMSGSVRATFEVSVQDIKRIRQKVVSKLKKPLHPSTFVLILSYTACCVVRAKGVEGNTQVYFAFAADCRARLDPPMAANFFGNCATPLGVYITAGDLVGEYGVVTAAEMLSEEIKGLEVRGVYETAKQNLGKLIYMRIETNKPKMFVSVAGSPQFRVYETDFGFGKPKKVQISSVDKTGAISMAESKDGSGGVEIGLVLKKHEMEVFESVFVDGLKDV
ncbi:hypothetical protein K2173_020195 [Erythroxylum novogranatense]|uniref:Uncharacterized protein n=1 Tax=Erythroxylum novogranatense TaxID=1862640 RepID=A0AAV8U7C2_9ROSI|nr:hypothetical protein K2173_020195 [Erythroxylum novogranatense]